MPGVGFEPTKPEGVGFTDRWVWPLPIPRQILMEPSARLGPATCCLSRNVICLEPTTGFGPVTCCLQNSCSTIELDGQITAGPRFGGGKPGALSVRPRLGLPRRVRLKPRLGQSGSGTSLGSALAETGHWATSANYCISKSKKVHLHFTIFSKPNKLPRRGGVSLRGSLFPNRYSTSWK